MTKKITIMLCTSMFILSILAIIENEYINGKKFIEIPEGIKTVLDQPIIKDFKPNYPKSLFKSGIMDNVIVYINVNKNGKVEKAEILKGRYPSLNEPILNAVKKMKFKPYKENGNFKSVQFIKMFFFPKKYDKIQKIKDEIVFSNLRLPNIIHKVLPEYTESVIQQNISDIIEMDVVHDIYGKVIEAKIVKGKYKVLNDLAITAIKNWVHEPLIISGIPLKMRYKLIIEFNPKNKKNVEIKLLYKLDYKRSYSSLKHILDLVKKTN